MQTPVGDNGVFEVTGYFIRLSKDSIFVGIGSGR